MKRKDATTQSGTNRWMNLRRALTHGQERCGKGPEVKWARYHPGEIPLQAGHGRFFEDVLGYDGLQDISREAQMKNQFVDVCLKVDGRVRLLVEAKPAGQQLRDRHIEQAQAYASQNNYRWVVLTNGVDWHLYHLTFDEGIEYERAFVVSLATDEGLDEAALKLALLHKQAVKKGELEEFWEKAAALGPGSICKALFSESVLMLLRREIRRDTGLLIDLEDLARSLQEMLSPETREQVGPMRVRKRRRTSRKTAEPASAATPPATEAAPRRGSDGRGSDGDTGNPG